jgi:RHS repeat-associated protein
LSIVISATLLAMLGPATALSSPPSDAFRYVHDADGRLKAAIDPEGDTVIYNWDAASNLISVERSPSDELSIIQLGPSKGEVGETIEIEGTGFSPTPESNIVKFNGTAATAIAASPWSLSVKVPAGATTGAVTVKTPEEGPVTSAQSFTVAGFKPSISSLSTSIAAAGEEVTISGSDFGPTTSDNFVRLNGSIPELTSAAESSIKFKVPSEGLGGKVSVATADGSSVGPDLFVPPSGVTVAKVGTRGRLTLGASKSAEFVGSEKVALMLFDGTAGQKASFVLSESSVSSGTASLWSPEGSQLAAASFSKSGGMLDATTLPATGTYTILLSPGAGTGSVKITSYSFEDVTGSIAPTEGGTKQSVSIATPGQVARYSVKVAAGQKIPVKTTSSNFSGKYQIDWIDPAGKLHADGGWWNGKEPDYFWAPTKFTSAGTYTLVVDPEGSYTGSVDLTLWDAPDIAGQTITSSGEGGSVTSTLKVPGQQELITFSGTTGQRLLLALSEVKFGGAVTIFTPSGSQVSGGSANFSSGASPLIGPLTLPATGTYTILVDPTGEQAGSVKLTAYAFEDVTGAISTPSEEGVQQKAATSVPGQVARYSVTVTAGQKISLKTTESNFSGKYEIDWLDPSGKLYVDGGWWNGKEADYFWNPVKFTSAGTYTLVVDPDGVHTGSVMLALKEAPDITGQTVTPSSEGGSVTSTIKVPGQQELITLKGTKDQRLALSSAESAFAGQFRLYNPSGSEIASDSIAKSEKRAIGPLTLPATGTYTILVDPTEEQTGSVKLTAFDVEDVTGSITPTEEGAKQKAATSVPGQAARYSVAVAAGQKISLKTTESNFSGKYEIDWLDPSGKLYADGGWWNGKEADWFWSPVKFTSAGTYTLVVDPEAAHTGSVMLTLWDAPDLTGQSITPSTEGGSVVSTIKAAGQRELITFSGSASQLVTLKAQESTIASGVMSILKPDGSQLSGSELSFSSGSSAKKEVTLPTTGTYTVVVDPTGANTGSVKTIVYLGSHVAWMMPSASTYRLVSFSTETPSVGPIEVSYSDIPQAASGKPTDASEAKPSKRQGKPSKGRTTSRAGSQPGGKKRNPRRTPKRVVRRKQGTTHLPSDTRQWEPKQKSWFPPKGSDERGWFAGRSSSPWLEVPSLQPAIETTALSGQALEVNGLSLPGLRVSIEGTSVTTRTDDSGRFLLAGAPAGHQVLLVDGESTPGKRYGTYEVAVELKEGETTELDYTIWLTPLDEAGDLHVASPTQHEASLTTPRIPGLEVEIPAGTTIRDAAGREVTDLNITAIPVDRAPFPLPPFVSVPVYFTVQPGRAYLSKGARFVYPNWAGLAPGQRVDFWNYDPEDRGWYVYGRGTVTPDGEQVAPDPGVRVWEFSGAMATSGATPPPYGPNCHPDGASVWRDGDGSFCGPSASGGDPVDLYTGLFTYHKADLTLPDEIPISIERTYRPNDSNSYSYGVGTTSLYDLRLWPIENYKHAVLVLPDGGLVDYERTSPGSGYTDAVYESKGPAGIFSDSTITFRPSPQAWELKTTSGLTYRFGWFTPLMEIEDRHGNKLTIKRTSGYYGDITQITSPHGRWARFTYDGSNRVTQVVDNGGRKVKYAYTSGRLTKVEGLEGRTTEYEYDKAGRMSAIVNARGNKYLTNAYDANGRVETQTTGDGATFDFDYDLGEKGEVEATTITDPRGSKRRVEFNADGFPVSETEAPGTEVEQTTTFERQPGTGLILSEADPLERETAYEYDSSGNVTEVTRLAGTEDAVTTKLKYEPGTTNVIEITDPNENTTEFEYGPDGEMLKRTDALGNETTFECNDEGQLTSILNPENEETKLSYEHGDLVAVTDPLGRTTRQFVDGLGRARAITLPGGQQTLFSYNDANEPTSMITPSGAETTIGYDKDGDVISLVDPRANETTAEYDVMDRPTAETNPLEDTAKWDYDKAGNLIEAVNRNGEVSEFSYDELGRLATAGFGVSGESAESTIEYEYDDADRLISVNDSASSEYVLGYDELDRLTEVDGPAGEVRYLYDQAGRRELMGISGRDPTVYSYDDGNRLTQVVRGIQKVSLEYDNADRLESLTLPNQIRQLYGYDKVGQLTSIFYRDSNEGTLGKLEYAYDPNGATEATWGSYARVDLPEAMKSAKYNAANQLTERDEVKLSYDPDGNLLADGANEFEWDARGQLSGISGESKASFGYDPFGRRILKTLGNEEPTELLYDGTNVIEERQEEETPLVLLTGLNPDQLFSRTRGGESIESYLTDRLGSVIALTDDSGEGTTTTYSYEPFGTANSAGAKSDNLYQFTGRENDGTGLQYNRARYYSPLDARFISSDPVGFNGGGSNLYEYAYGNPLDFTDPSGECVMCIPGFNPVAPVEDAADQIGKWVSDAPGVASEVGDSLLDNLTAAEAKRLALEEVLGAALCRFATRVAIRVPDRRAWAAAGATCLAGQTESAWNFGWNASDHD